MTETQSGMPGEGADLLPVDMQAEGTFRERAIQRLVTDHADMGQEHVDHWLGLLNDQEPVGRVLAATAVWTMMDVRDARRVNQ